MTSYATEEVRLLPELSVEIRDHVHSDIENEVGGVLVGTLRDGTADVRHVLPALEAVGGAAQLTFTHEVWEHLLSTVDGDFPDEQIVGWYHSHPGHGIFLSSFDQFIHENFFSAPGMVALVVDPRDEDNFGWFGWKDGALVRLGSDLPVDRPDRAAIPTEITGSASRRESEERTMDTIQRGVLVAVGVLIVFFAGMWFRSSDVDRAERQQTAAAQEAAHWQRAAQERTAQLVLVCEALPAAKRTQPPAEPTATEPSTDDSDGPTASPTATTATSPTEDDTEKAPRSRAAKVCSTLSGPVTPSPSPSPVGPDPGDKEPAATAEPAPSPSG